jgi:hypothetical protein
MKRSVLAGMLLALSVGSTPAAAEQRYALIVSGATGGPEYAEQYDRWSSALSATLADALKFDRTQVTVLSEAGRGGASASAGNVRRVLESLRERISPADLLFVVLIGHGTFDGVDAKFNLVGPDMESAEWSALLRQIPGRLVVVNTTSASFPFLERLAGRRRIVITATDSPAQRFDTVFPEYFVEALADERADLDKNGRISIWESFAAASGSVRRYYQQRGQLPTERALLDDNGDGVGIDVTNAGTDGSYASRTYLDESLPGAPPTDEILAKLLQRRTILEAEVEDLKIRRTFLPAAEYAREFERIMIELANVSHDIRQRTKS